MRSLDRLLREEQADGFLRNAREYQNYRAATTTEDNDVWLDLYEHLRGSVVYDVMASACLSEAAALGFDIEDVS